MRIFCMIIFQNTVNDLTVHRSSKEEQVDYLSFYSCNWQGYIALRTSFFISEFLLTKFPKKLLIQNYINSEASSMSMVC